MDFAPEFSTSGGRISSLFLLETDNLLQFYCCANRLTMNSALIMHDAVYCEPTHTKGGRAVAFERTLVAIWGLCNIRQIWNNTVA